MQIFKKKNINPGVPESKSIPKPNHVPGTSQGNELASKGREPGRQQAEGRPYRSARDSSSINPQAAEPILPEMPNIPPA